MDKISGYVGLALRGGFIRFGEDALRYARQDLALFVASDASANTIDKIEVFLKNAKAFVIRKYTKEELSLWVGKEQVAIFIVTNRSLSRQIKKELQIEGE